MYLISHLSVYSTNNLTTEDSQPVYAHNSVLNVRSLG